MFFGFKQHLGKGSFVFGVQINFNPLVALKGIRVKIEEKCVLSVEKLIFFLLFFHNSFLFTL